MNIDQANASLGEGSPVAADSHCANCDTRLQGPHCHACGQPVKGMVRHFSSILGDLFDTLLALDSRIGRTLGPLLTRPGFLTSEYLTGRRVRYVSPVRLFIFLCLTTFFVVRLSTDININLYDSEIARAETVADVERLRDQTLANLAEAKEASAEVPAALHSIELAAQKVRQQAEARMAQLNGEELRDGALPAEGASVETSAADEICLPDLGGGCWNPEAEPVQVNAFPQAWNAWLTVQAVSASKNTKVLREDPNRFMQAWISAIPSTLFALLPLFALLLWCLYVFERRLYMEHLIVALHSHAFLSLALLLVTLLLDMQAWLKDYAAVDFVCDWAIALLLLWMPLYLLLMQKRIYGQGWGITLVKFFTLGTSYALLLSVGATVTLLASLAWM
ncbi:DUF3667 domain-containing protein [Microbulbifer taiwanensis]|uniref:DUF3667 domain-containing protein n=1 Tax=Microbulbifer taiwanensis TaxID=986746 RepID=A0ABW1YQE8_9GAMM|nr:DUF3667 domain-containing protein [Microbulbifer taiwanensis]